MIMRNFFPFALCGAVAGAVNGLFGAGGGILLVPLLTKLTTLEDNEIFPASVCIIAPICIVSILMGENILNFPWLTALPYLIGSVIGGILAGFFSKKISTVLLHRILGAFIIWGGIRYLC